MTRSRFFFLFLIILGLLTVMPRAGYQNDVSRMATIKSLVENHTFVIDKTIFNTSDKVLINGHYYSDKQPLPSIIGAVVYFPTYYLGYKLAKGWNIAYYLVTLFTIKLFWFIGLIAFYLSLKFTDINEKNRLWLTLSLGVGSLYFTFSSTFNNHVLAGAFLILGFYFLLKAKNFYSVGLNLFLASFFLLLAGLCDVPIGCYYAMFLFYVLRVVHLRKKVWLYLLPIILTVLPMLYIDYCIYGTVLPVQLHKSYFLYPGSMWTRVNQLSGMAVNSFSFFLKYSFNMLIGEKGFLLYNPLLFIAIFCLILEIKNKRKFRLEASVISVASLIIVMYYLLMTNNYGGWSYSIRWFIPMLPLLFFIMYSFFENFGTIKRLIFLSLLTVSIIVSCIGLINPWSIDLLSSSPIIANIKQFKYFGLREVVVKIFWLN